jgi:SWI/SNF-related matrix-associated actin-dependent regulator 1 of chromatin subfamily A
VADVQESDPEGKLIIFAHHVDIQNEILSLYPGAARVFAVDKPEVRKSEVDRFQTDDDCRIAVVSMMAGGVGLTMTAAYRVLFVELPWRPGDLEQAIARAYGRVNDPHPVDAYHMIGHGTIDEDIFALIESKRSVADTGTGRGEGSDEDDEESVKQGLMLRLKGRKKR